jgi:hypothetical protein
VQLTLYTRPNLEPELLLHPLFCFPHGSLSRGKCPTMADLTCGGFRWICTLPRPAGRSGRQTTITSQDHMVRCVAFAARCSEACVPFQGTTVCQV